MFFFQRLTLYNQGIRNFTNSKMHALVNINPLLLFFVDSGGVYPLKKVPYAVIPVIMLFSTGHTIDVFN